jgi:cholesterol transport system auxiliary component
MITFRKLAAAASALALGLALSGCLTLFPKTVPVQLYRFGQGPVAVEAGGGAPVVVLHGPTSFTAEAAGDRILTSYGRAAAFIGGARWVAPAAVLFDEAEIRAFSAPDAPVRLVARGQNVLAPLSLRLNVETFEARYLAGPKSAPTVVVVVVAELSRLTDRQILRAKTFEVRKPAAANRVGAIVDAFDAATADVLAQAAAWTGEEGATAPISRTPKPS